MGAFIIKLEQILYHMEYYNIMSPFPFYDTEIIKDLKELIRKMKHLENDYDELPVTACKYCKSLYVTTDELDNDICMSCGSINEIETYDTIKEYLNNK